MSNDPSRTDSDGWQYAVDFPHFDSTAIWASSGPHNKGTYFVRRRRHLCKVAPRAYKLAQYDISPESSPTGRSGSGNGSGEAKSPTSALSPSSPSSGGRRKQSDSKPLLTFRVINKTDRSLWIGVYEGDDQLRRVTVGTHACTPIAKLLIVRDSTY
jgi:hypothetical protein